MILYDNRQSGRKTKLAIVGIFMLVLLKENKEDCHDEADECGEMVPLQGLSLEHHHCYEGEDSE